MDDATILAMKTTLDLIRLRTTKAIDELTQDHYQNALLNIMIIILDLSNVAYDLNRHLLYKPSKE